MRFEQDFITLFQQINALRQLQDSLQQGNNICHIYNALPLGGIIKLINNYISHTPAKNSYSLASIPSQIPLSYQLVLTMPQKEGEIINTYELPEEAKKLPSLTCLYLRNNFIGKYKTKPPLNKLNNASLNRYLDECTTPNAFFTNMALYYNLALNYKKDNRLDPSNPWPLINFLNLDATRKEQFTYQDCQIYYDGKIADPQTINQGIDNAIRLDYFIRSSFCNHPQAYFISQTKPILGSNYNDLAAILFPETRLLQAATAANSKDMIQASHV